MRTHHQRRVLRRVRYSLLAALAGGSLFGACEVRLHDAIVGGSMNFLSSLLNPDKVLPLLFPATDAASNTPNGP